MLKIGGVSNNILYREDLINYCVESMIRELQDPIISFLMHSIILFNIKRLDIASRNFINFETTFYVLTAELNLQQRVTNHINMDVPREVCMIKYYESMTEKVVDRLIRNDVLRL